MRNEYEQIEQTALTLELEDLDLSETEVEVLDSEDARALPEMGASFGNDFCCTICCCSA